MNLEKSGFSRISWLIRLFFWQGKRQMHHPACLSFRTLIKELQDYYHDKSVDLKPMRGVHTKAAGVPPLNSCEDKPSGKQVVARLPRVQQESTIDSEVICKF
jgi:hypothetical protein